MADLLPFATTTADRWVRPRQFAVTHVDLDVTIDLAAQSVAGSVTHQVRWIAKAQGEVVFDQHGIEIGAVQVDGQATIWVLGADDVRIAIPAQLASAATHAVRIEFRTSEPRKGLYFITPTADRVAMAWTQGAMEDHAHWFPCYDSPNNLSTYRIAVRHRAEFTALAGGVREGRSEHGDGWATTVHVQDRPHVLYLVNVVVGDIVGIDDPACPVPVTHWLPRGREACAPAVFRATAFAIAELGRFIGVPYPWQRYGHAVVHRFMWGGMENTTLTTITDRVLVTPEEQRREDVDSDSLVIHELVHQWFGDLLTMKGWSDIWLNESFATYLEARITARWRALLTGGAEKEADVLALELWHNRGAYLDQHGGRYQRALVTNRWDDAYELFDRVAYEQGSLVLHTLCRWLGEERFHAALKLYTERHRHGLVETADFRQAVEDATGEPADWFFDQWVMAPGHPSLTVRWSHDPVRGQLAVTIEQGTPHRRLPLTVAAAGLTEQAVELAGAACTVVFTAAEAPAWIAVDPRGAVLAEIDEDRAQPALIADAAAPAHARARACGVAGRKHPDAALIAAVVAAAQTGPELVREEAIEALAAWRLHEPLIALYAQVPERHRRSIAAALGKFRGERSATVVADQLVAWADASVSGATAGDLLAARGAVEAGGATPLLRARLGRPSWNHRLQAGVVRGLGASGEAAALDEVLGLLAKEDLPEPVLTAALGAAAALGARHPLVRERVRRALEPFLKGATLAIRAMAAKAFATLGDPAARGALRAQREREEFGNVRRVLRESLHALDQSAATTAATAELTRRLDDLEKAKARLEARLDALEKKSG